MNPNDAERLGLTAGQWVWIESPWGKVREVVDVYYGIRQGVVNANHGWWYPEIDTASHGFELVNINCLMDPYGGDVVCVSVCPTGASVKNDDGTVTIDAETCIGCQSCIPACPYGVRYLNEELNVVQKCTMCAQLVSEGSLPACVQTCGGRARFFGDLDEGIESFEGPWHPEEAGTYDEQMSVRVKINDAIEPYTEGEMFRFPDMGNDPQNIYILRNTYGDRRDRTWQGLTSSIDAPTTTGTH